MYWIYRDLVTGTNAFKTTKWMENVDDNSWNVPRGENTAFIE